MSEWKTIDSAPTDAEVIIGHQVIDGVPLVFLASFFVGRWKDYNNFDCEPTHWMPYVKPLKIHSCVSKNRDWFCRSGKDGGLYLVDYRGMLMRKYDFIDYVLGFVMIGFGVVVWLAAVLLFLSIIGVVG